MSLDLRFCWFRIPQTLVNGTWSGLLAQANTLGRHWDKVSWDCNRLWSENEKEIGPQAIQHPTDSWSSGEKVVKMSSLPSCSSRTQQYPLLALNPKYLYPHLFLMGQIDSILRWGIYLCSENSQGSKSFTIWASDLKVVCIEAELQTDLTPRINPQQLQGQLAHHQPPHLPVLHHQHQLFKVLNITQLNSYHYANLFKHVLPVSSGY